MNHLMPFEHLAIGNRTRDECHYPEHKQREQEPISHLVAIGNHLQKGIDRHTPVRSQVMAKHINGAHHKQWYEQVIGLDFEELSERHFLSKYPVTQVATDHKEDSHEESVDSFVHKASPIAEDKAVHMAGYHRQNGKRLKVVEIKEARFGHLFNYY